MISRDTEKIPWLLRVQSSFLFPGGSDHITTTFLWCNRCPWWKVMLGIWSRRRYTQKHLLKLLMPLLLHLFLQVFVAFLHESYRCASWWSQFENFEVWSRQKLLTLIFRKSVHVTSPVRWKLWMIWRCFWAWQRQLFLNERLFVAIDWSETFLLCSHLCVLQRGC